MENEKYASYSFKKGSIIGGIIFIYYIIMSFVSNPFSSIHLFIYVLLMTSGLAYTFVRYKQAVLKTKIKYGRFMAIGTIISLVVAFFWALFYAIYIIKIDPLYFQTSIEQGIQLLEDKGLNDYAAIYQKDSMFKIMQIFSIIGIYLQEFIMNIIISLIVSFVIYRISPKLNNEDNQTL
ncbi:MAG: DUF4199 domain-containing protein [Bacteroidales bacterium]|jgi:hypothetical protein|nr:DUF4199 domain-containing protein [Bacteroidales bacterium]